MRPDELEGHHSHLRAAHLQAADSITGRPQTRSLCGPWYAAAPHRPGLLTLATGGLWALLFSWLVHSRIAGRISVPCLLRLLGSYLLGGHLLGNRSLRCLLLSGLRQARLYMAAASCKSCILAPGCKPLQQLQCCRPEEACRQVCSSHGINPGDLGRQDARFRTRRRLTRIQLLACAAASQPLVQAALQHTQSVFTDRAGSSLKLLHKR